VTVGILMALAVAATPAEYYNQGNKAYEAGDYLNAVELYDSAAAKVTHADILFNRGNARFKLGLIGRAVADYSRAWVLNPYDPEPRQNLEFCRAYRPDKATTLQNPLVKVLVAVLRVLDLGLAKLLTGVLFLLALAALALLLTRGGRAWLWVSVGLGVACLYSFLSWMSWTQAVSPDRAVVVVPEVTLRSGPGEDYKDIVVVHDGLEASIRSRRGRYVLLQVPGGTGGWADSSSVELIFPH
jgi:tetratricopeptide (TPR) repeat protein